MSWREVTKFPGLHARMFERNDLLVKVSFFLCVIPENIHTPPTEGIGNHERRLDRGGGGGGGS